MTEMWRPTQCGNVYGCVEHDHSQQDCYWRYVDDNWGLQGTPVSLLSYDQWREHGYGE